MLPSVLNEICPAFAKGTKPPTRGKPFPFPAATKLWDAYPYEFPLRVLAEQGAAAANRRVPELTPPVVAPAYLISDPPLAITILMVKPLEREIVPVMQSELTL